MDLTARLLRFAAARPHVLVVAAAGHTAERLAVEAELARRGWPAAMSPADTDVLVVAGVPGPELAPVIESLWQQVPAPRARADVPETAVVGAVLDQAVALLADPVRQRRDPTPQRPSPATDVRPRQHAEHQHSEHQHDSHDHGSHDHGGGMGMPGGLPMADVGPDRDGLTLDRLRVPLGPVLPDWPAGLVVEVVLQGDVVQEATARILDRAGQAQGSFWDAPDADRARRAAARHLDGLARLLGTAGWADPAATARHLRDELLSGAPVGPLRLRTEALVATVRRSRTLRRMLRGLGRGAAGVDTLLGARLSALESAATDLDRPTSPVGGAGWGAGEPGIDELAELLVGAELAAARLIVAAVDPDTDRLPTDHPGHVHRG
ncbi:hypothetical protein ACQPZA_16480 [Pseudonocardia xinjiangensis]|uniref:hypothetical protein n=1 Tax=Pseudonocardia xinjiangensis TaxID=75289 RepID=UPI003D8B0502